MNNNILGVFRERLPRRPYYTDYLEFGLHIASAPAAALHRHIQPNPPGLLTWLVFDIDRPGAADAAYLADLPPPTITAINPKNGHAHLFYGLEVPVVKTQAGRAAPIRYAEAIEAAYHARLLADPGYSGLIAKNPLAAAWLVYTSRLYTLAYLAEFVDLGRPRPAQAVGVGRNVSLFDALREWAYSWVRTYKNEADFDTWTAALAGQAAVMNRFEAPLHESEVRGIVKSVARWTWRRFNDAEFRKIQAARGRRGGRPATTTANGAPWDAAGVSRATYYRRLKSGLLVPE